MNGTTINHGTNIARMAVFLFVPTTNKYYLSKYTSANKSGMRNRLRIIEQHKRDKSRARTWNSE